MGSRDKELVKGGHDVRKVENDSQLFTKCSLLVKVLNTIVILSEPHVKLILLLAKLTGLKFWIELWVYKLPVIVPSYLLLKYLVEMGFLRLERL